MRTTSQRRVRHLHEFSKYDVVPICGYRLVFLSEFGVVPLRKSVPVLLFTASCRVISILYTVQDDTFSSFSQRTASVFPFYPKRQCRRSASLLLWVKFIYTPGVSSSCDMVGMCTGISFAFCSPGSPSFFPPRTCSSPPLVPPLIHCPGYHGI